MPRPTKPARAPRLSTRAIDAAMAELTGDDEWRDHYEPGSNDVADTRRDMRAAIAAALKVDGLQLRRAK